MSSAITLRAVSDEPWFDADTETMRVTRKLGKSGGSTVLRIPPGILKTIGVDRGDKVELFADPEERELRVRPVE